ncbi:hypothetical protein ENBRE01_3250 [Enteropsectra breve]|nr:hypothetical protein ENBRE01_3250 [Enteropsectra breve]
MLPPKTKRQIQRIIGLINWFREFIPSLSRKIEPITALLQQNSCLSWTDSHSNIVRSILKEIKNRTVLSIPDFSKEFQLYTDASDKAIGGVLVQNDRTIGYFSKKLSGSQCNYTVTEKEMLAVIASLEHFRNIILLSHVTIKTDHCNLTYNTAITNNRVQRWKVMLGDYNITWEYLPGANNQAADHLSRCFFLKPNTTDSKSQKIREEILLAAEGNQSYNSPDLKTEQRLSIQEKHVENLLLQLHQSTGHVGTKKLYQSLKSYLHIKNLYKRLQSIRQSCQECQLYAHRKCNYGPLTGHLDSTVPFQDISTDIVGPYDTRAFRTTRTERKFYILTFTDRNTRWSELYLIFDLRPESLIKGLQSWIAKHRPPATILSDHGTQYRSKKFHEFLKEKEIKQILSTKESPNSNGISERINQSINHSLRTAQGTSLSEAVSTAQLSLQILYNRSLKCSPIELAYNSSPFNVTDKAIPDLQPLAKNSKEKTTAYNRTARNQKRLTNYEYKLGQKVYRKILSIGKLSPLWQGPYTIKDIVPEQGTLIIEDETGKLRRTNAQCIRPL